MNKKSPFYVPGFMVIICIIFGSAIAVVFNLTRDSTLRNEVLNRNRTIANAFGLVVASSSADSYAAAVAREIDYKTLDEDGRQWEVFIRKKAPHDIGFVFKGIGFWDAISGILVLSPDLSSIVSIRFLEQHETPGLGARIEEPWFYGQFAGKKLSWNGKMDGNIVIGPGPKDQPNRVDAITGATQTSLALMRTLNRDLDAFRRAYEKHRDTAMEPIEGAIAWR